MADRTLGGQAIDERTKNLKKRQMAYEIQSLRLSIVKHENDIYAAELNIGRIRESIEATEVRIQDKQAELDEMSSEGGELDG